MLPFSTFTKANFSKLELCLSTDTIGYEGGQGNTMFVMWLDKKLKLDLILIVLKIPDWEKSGFKVSLSNSKHLLSETMAILTIWLV